MPSCSSASQTMPIPPSPSCDSRRNPPTTSPILKVGSPSATTVIHTRGGDVPLLDRGQERVQIERPERVDYLRIEMLAALAADLGSRLVGLPGLRVRP